jgi:hypothetical protein
MSSLVVTAADLANFLQIEPKKSKEIRLLLCVAGEPIPLEIASGQTSCIASALVEKVSPQIGLAASRFAISLYVWVASGNDLADARATLGIATLPTLFAVRSGEFLDKLHGPQLQDSNAVQAFCKSIRNMADGKRLVSTDSDGRGEGTAAPPTKLRVDIARMIVMGKDLMAKSSPVYAEKFFLKALGVLDAAALEMTGGAEDEEHDDVQASIALSLAWLVMAQLVQGRSNANSNECLARLRSDRYARWTSVALSDEMRSVATGVLFAYAPLQWTGESCSATKLAAKLSAEPTDDSARSMLVLTHFLSGDVERCLTEALKLHVRGVEFGAIALTEVCRFLGPENPLVRKCGWKVPQHGR